MLRGNRNHRSLARPATAANRKRIEATSNVDMACAMIVASRPTAPPRRTWTGAEFDRLAEQGMFDGQRVELIDGEILEMPPMNDPHAQSVQLGNYALPAIFPATTATIRVQLPMRLGESRPFPDLVVAEGTPREVNRHPETALLVVEMYLMLKYIRLGPSSLGTGRYELEGAPA